MTKISVIQGVERSLLKRQKTIGAVPANEYSDRAKLVLSSDYIPYLSLSKGEMSLALLRDQAATFAQAFPDQKAHQQAINMLDKALRGSVHSGIGFVGAIPDNLQILASQIKNAVTATAPAAGHYIGRATLADGVQIGDDQIVKFTEADCFAYGARKANEFYNLNWSPGQYVASGNTAKMNRFQYWVQDCAAQKAIEKILNDKMVDSAHHMIYNRIPTNYPGVKIQAAVVTKRILHNAGIGGYQDVTGVDPTLISAWIETAILRKNTSAGAGPLDSITTSLSLSPDSEQVALFNAWVTAQKDAKINKTHGVQGIGVLPVAIIVAIIAAAVQVASQVVAALQKQKAAAMSAANGFGSFAYQATRDDWSALPSGQNALAPTTTDTNSLLIPALLVGAGAYYLSQK